MTTDVDQALEIVAGLVVGVSALLYLLVVAEKLLMRPKAARDEAARSSARRRPGAERSPE